ncbi:aminotransferase class III-fold pyridoxal phosphate-dependent enzyme [Shigella flexneri]
MITPVRWSVAKSGRGRCDGCDARFLQGLRQLCDQHRRYWCLMKCSAGWGRLAICFLHALRCDADILTSAKALGGGFPISAMLTTANCCCVHPGSGDTPAVILWPVQ